MSNSFTKIPTQKILKLGKRFRFVIFLSLFAAIYSFLMFTINELGNQKPGQAAINLELQTVNKLKVDESVLERMLQLTEENIEIQSLYNEARNNPFSE